MKEERPNELIPILIDKFTQYSNKLKDRIKINGIFAEFDENARIKLNKFIKLSQARYKGVKSGNSLESILYNQKPGYNKLTEKILGDKFYQTDEIEIENKKLFKKPEKKENLELNELRNKIKQGTKDFSKNEIRKREQLLDKVNKKREYQKETERQMKISRLNFNYEPRFMEKISPTTKSISNEEETEDLAQNKESIQSEKQKFVKSIEDLMNDDEENFRKNVMEYKEYLKEIAESHQKGEGHKIKPSPSTHTFNFLTDNIKLLSYKEETNEKVIPKKKEDTKIDIVKLMRYTKRGKSAKWMKLENAKSGSLSNFETTQNTFSFNKTFSDFRNTIKTVKSEAEKAIKLDENFDQKRETMEGFFKRNELPRLEDYENMLNMKSGQDFWKNNENTKDGQNTLSSQRRSKRRNILSAFNRTYKSKREEWKKEDLDVESRKIREIERKKNINNYLKEIQNVKRKPHLYVDGYSQRDGDINKKLNLFNKTLNGGFYSKRMLENKVQLFDEREEQKRQKIQTPIEKVKLNDNINEIIQNKQNELENEVMRKMQANLKEDQESEDFEFNFEVNAQKIAENKKEPQEDPYKEYLEFYNIVSKRKEEQDIFFRNKKATKVKPYSKSVILNAEENYLMSKQKLVNSNSKVQKRFASLHEKREPLQLKKVSTAQISENKIDLNKFSKKESESAIGISDQGNNTKLILVEHIKETN